MSQNNKKRDELTFEFHQECKNWKSEWKGMPEYNSSNKMPWKSIYVHFDNYEQLQEFSKLVGQKVTTLTKYIYFPKKENQVLKDKRYVDES